MLLVSLNLALASKIDPRFITRSLLCTAPAGVFIYVVDIAEQRPARDGRGGSEHAGGNDARRGVRGPERERVRETETGGATVENTIAQRSRGFCA